MLDRDRRDQPDHRGGDAEQERADARVLGDRDELAVQEDREHERRQEDPERHRQPAGEAAGEVADEGREDDQRRRQDAADREPVDELALGEPAVGVDGLPPAGTGSP